MPTRESSDVLDEKREKYLLQNIRCKLKVMVYVVRPLCFCYVWRAGFNSLFITCVITRLSTLATGGVPRGSDSTLNSGVRVLHKRTQMLRRGDATSRAVDSGKVCALCTVLSVGRASRWQSVKVSDESFR